MGKEKYGVDAYKKVANMTSDASSKGGDKKTVANTWGLQDLLALAMNQQGADSRDGMETTDVRGTISAQGLLSTLRRRIPDIFFASSYSKERR